MEGPVDKRSDYLGIWRKRFLSLEGHYLILYSASRARALRVVNLNASCKVACSGRVVRVFHSNTGRWRSLRCATAHLAILWTQAIDSAIASSPAAIRENGPDRKRFPEWATSLLDINTDNWVSQPSSSATRQVWSLTLSPSHDALPFLALILFTAFCAVLFHLMFGTAVVFLAIAIIFIVAWFNPNFDADFANWLALQVKQYQPVFHSVKAPTFFMKTYTRLNIDAESAKAILLDTSSRFKWDPNVVRAVPDAKAGFVLLTFSNRSLLVEQKLFRLDDSSFIIAEHCDAYSSIFLFEQCDDPNSCMLTRLCRSSISDIDLSTIGIEALRQNVALAQKDLPNKHRGALTMKAPVRERGEKVSILDTALALLRSRIPAFMDLAQSENGWVRCKSSSSDLTIYEHSDSHIPLVKGIAEINHPAEFVMAILSDLKFKPQYDADLDSGHEINRWEHLRLAIVHLTYKSVWPVTSRDFCVTAHWIHLRDGSGYLLYATDAITPECPPNPEYVRGRIIHAGYLIQRRDGDKQCRVTWVAQVDLGRSLSVPTKRFAALKQPQHILGIARLLDSIVSSQSINIAPFMRVSSDLEVQATFGEEGPAAGSSSQNGITLRSCDQLGSDAARASLVELGEHVVASCTDLIHRCSWKRVQSKLNTSSFAVASQSDLLQVRTMIATTPSEILAVLFDVNRRHWYDKSVARARRLDLIDGCTALDLVDNSMAFGKWSHIVLSHWKPLDDASGFILGQCSTDNVEDTTLSCRTLLGLTGWHIQTKSTSDSRTTVVFVAKLNLTSSNSANKDGIFKTYICAVETLSKLFS
uniref:START domain-containing protein n=1 Tax=Spongospora subterranea TaxID=70186 RepID=A0A0H5QX21_9EUKA|eukprot:CRZ06528.1 hypothetical protein [Spongospora subterranea]